MLLDTSGLLSIIHRREPQHDAAVTYYETANTRVTHSYILDEFVALSQARRLPREIALEFSTRLISDPEIETV